MPGSRPSSSCSTSKKASTCACVCAEDKLTRSLQVPAGTVGGRMAGTWKPRANSCLLSCSEAASSPTTNGMIGLAAGTPRR
jgi:hypothetical protein